MLDFLLITTRVGKKGNIEIYPKFIMKSSSDLMIRGGDFYAIWNEEKNLWSTSEEDAIYLIDKELDLYKKEHENELGGNVKVYYMWDADNGTIDRFHKYVQKQCRDNFRVLDERIIFANEITKKTDYASKKLSYALEPGTTDAYDELMSTLYSDEERRKIEWAIGSIVTGESKHIQKFVVMYGAAGTGKSTVLNIIQELFEGYYSVFDAKALGSSNSSFALEAFKTNPLVAIQHDGDLSKIEDNTRLNSVVSHELMIVNEKFKSTYANRFICFLFMGTNKPVKITDAKSGIIRRLIDVSPTGNKLSPSRYNDIVERIKLELGAIAWKCKCVYEESPGEYDNYIPSLMMGASNDFYNFIMDNYDIFKKEDSTTLKDAWDMYSEYCEETKVLYPMSQRPFKEELKNYFNTFEERITINGTRVRNYYKGFKTNKFEKALEYSEDKKDIYISFKEQDSYFDYIAKDYPAQYANDAGTPINKWSKVKTTLKDIDTTKLHYVKVPENHIVIDFDLKDDTGNKDYNRNLKAASKWPKTYAELSKSGSGIHLHYIYNGDVSKLAPIYSEGIEVKVYTGNSSLRRLRTLCNDEPIACLTAKLPEKKEKQKMVNSNAIISENKLRDLIQKAINKEIPPYSTKSGCDFIFKILTDAYNSGVPYDLTYMRPSVLSFAASSTNNSDYCIKLVAKMPFNSEIMTLCDESIEPDKMVFFDCEVFPNLTLICWKYEGENQTVHRMFNPSRLEIVSFMKLKLVGYNNRRYDNHIVYGLHLGYSPIDIFYLSKKIVEGAKDAFFGSAYNISYTDVYDFCSEKKSLKKWEIELGIPHKECRFKWDEPVPEKYWNEIADYCCNDVLAAEAVFNSRRADFTARLILAELAGGIPNDTTNSLTTKIIFGNEKNPKLVYTDLSKEFPGYEYVAAGVIDSKPHNMYRGVDMGFGGYVYSEPGMYRNVALLDVASLHPHSIKAMNCFGEYTKNFVALMDARIYIKHKDYESVKLLFDGKLAKYLTDQNSAKQLSQALKIAINSVYGLTSASFPNVFRDPRNINNIVALRGALFMKTLQDEVAARGFTVAHIKTDSIKIPNATPEIISFCMEFANKYGYTFEHEATYDRMCLVNDACYIAKYKDGENAGKWTATAAQFQVPYVFKKLFSHEEIEFKDLCETKEVKAGELYLDYNENLGDEHDYRYVGKIGLFCPMMEGCGSAELFRMKDDKYYAAAGTKGYRWMESEDVKSLGKENYIDFGYYEKLADDARATIEEYCNFDEFVA